MKELKFNENLYSQYKKQGSCCYYCKKEIPYSDMTRDHFLPVSKGNTLVNNKVFACRKCNSLKGDKSIDEFKDYLLVKITDILKNVVKNDWKISEKDLTLIRLYTRLLNTTGEIIENNYKPLFIFT
jgi:5-methylcytosine-specific restriction endonuclease McrA